MATITVTTWAELVTAYTSTVTNGDTIKLINDIDCNSEIPEGVATSIAQKTDVNFIIDGSYTEEENGVIITKSRVIRNLRTNIISPVSIFAVNSGSSAYSITWQYIDFINLVLDNSLLNTDSPRTWIKFKNCRFVGRRKRELLNLNSNSTSDTPNVMFTSCFFNVPNTNPTADYHSYRLIDKVGSTTNRDTLHITANYCWFRETNMGKVFDVPAIQSYNFNKSGCYIDGEILVKGSLATDVYSVIGTAGKIDIDQSGGTIQNVYDVQILVSTPDTNYPIGSIEITGGKGLFKTLGKHINTDTSIPSVDFVNNNATYTIFATPENMTDPAALYAKGFDIVVP